MPCSKLSNAIIELIEDKCSADASDLLVDDSRFGQLIQTAVAEKFVLELFPNTFVIAQRWAVEEMAWQEWHPGFEMEARYGSLRLFAHRDRSQKVHSLCLGVVSIPDRCSWRCTLSYNSGKMILADKIDLMTCNFGRHNKRGIAKTAVAARATIDD